MKPSLRLSIISAAFLLVSILVFTRLFYWQVLAADDLVKKAQSQREAVIKVAPVRGNILASDNFALVSNQEAYLAYLSLKDLKVSKKEAIDKIAPIIVPSLDEIKIATDTPIKLQKEQLEKETKNVLTQRFTQNGVLWAVIKHKISLEQKKALENLSLGGVGFELEPKRSYAEASMSAHLLGFVGAADNGEDTGYFGLEGFYDLDLKGRYGFLQLEKDAANRPILIGNFFDQEKRDGRSIKLFLDRAIQFLVEKHLKKALEKYGAKSGSVIVADPKTGGILAMASLPSYDPRFFPKYENKDYKNPLTNDLYEPGSTFKVLVMAAALQESLVKSDTKCDICEKPYKIDKYTIRTWNNKYYPESTMTEVLEHSDNVGMVFVGQKLGIDKFVDYIKLFGFGKKTGIDLQDEVSGKLRERWSDVDLATATFGQGIAVTGIQMLSAVGSLANEGKYMVPRVVNQIIDEKKVIQIQPKTATQIIDKKTAETITAMMVEAVDKGDAKWAKPKGYKIAGKTGTSQVPIAGHYDKEKTIASFIGYAPADKPRFVMLVKLTEPTSSPWGSETAAPLFFNIAKEILIYFGVSPKS